jgi:hypothetical protein
LASWKEAGCEAFPLSCAPALTSGGIAADAATVFKKARREHPFPDIIIVVADPVAFMRLLVRRPPVGTSLNDLNLCGERWHLRLGLILKHILQNEWAFSFRQGLNPENLREMWRITCSQRKSKRENLPVSLAKNEERLVRFMDE